MKFEFEITKQDYIDYNVYHMKNSDTIKKSLFIQRYVLAIIYLVLPFILAKVTNIELWYWLTVFGVVAILWIVFYPKYFVSATTKRISKMVDEGKNKDMLGRHTLTLNDEGISDTSENSETKISWSGVEVVKESDEHFFIYISSIMAYIVPKRVFENENSKNEFLEFVKGKYTK